MMEAEEASKMKQFLNFRLWRDEKTGRIVTVDENIRFSRRYLPWSSFVG
jgi:hypothetical protein